MSNAMQGPFVAPSIPEGGPNVPWIGIRIPYNVSTTFDPSNSNLKSAILEAIELGYRHLQTSVSLHLEHHKAIGEAIVEALERGLVSCREHLFLTSNIQYDDDVALDSVIQDLKSSLENLHLEYVDLYIIEWRGNAKKLGEDETEKLNDNVPSNELMAAVWAAMEECRNLGLTKSIGVCNFSSKMLQNMLKYAKSPPCVNQVGMQSLLREKELREFCLANKISIIAFSTIGENDNYLNSSQLLESGVLNRIAKHGQKTADQIVFRWAFEVGAACLLESLKKEHMQEILNISEWRLSEDI